MRMTTEIDIRRLTRIEGHGNIVITIDDGEVGEVRWEVTESPRFFEAMFQGKSWEMLPRISGRICGICSIGHTLASIRAIENAFGYTPSAQTSRLRLLIKHMETLQSHILHIFFLAAPDYLGRDSFLALRGERADVVRLAVRLRKMANDGADLIGGRRLHPTRLVPGGMTMVPGMDELAGFRHRLDQSRRDLAEAAEIVAGFVLPEFSRPTEYVSLHGETTYPFIGGELMSSDGQRQDESNYLPMTNEYHVDRSTAKWSSLSRKSFCVGARARLNNNSQFLHGPAFSLAERLGLLPVCHNPFANNLAQLIECVHVVEEAILLLEELLGNSWRHNSRSVLPREGSGVGAVEVPRGILYHAYSFDREGRCTDADCVIPTSQNHGSIQQDLEQLVHDSVAAGRSTEEIKLLAEMLVRAYDPCISCSVH